ncbi:MAG: hypothetical protein ACR2HR_03895 [Euzebya sp.]
MWALTGPTPPVGPVSATIRRFERGACRWVMGGRRRTADLETGANENDPEGLLGLMIQRAEDDE